MVDFENQPTFDDFRRELQKRKSAILRGVLAFVVLFIGYTCFFRVDASDEGVVLRFGKHIGTSPPGLHMKLPWPIDKVYSVPVQRIQSLEFGFKTQQPGRTTEYAPAGQNELDVSEMLTGDLNLAHVEWVVQFRIKDSRKYLFSVGDTVSARLDALPSGAAKDANIAIPDTIRDISESVLRKLVGDNSIDAVLTFGREEIGGQAKIQIQQMLDEFDAGVELVAVKLQSTSPPEQVKDAFQEVNRARQNKERIVNEAEGERNRQIPAARGKRDQAVSEAEGYQERVVLETTGEVNAFLSQLKEYEVAPDITRKRLYLEAMQELLEQSGNTIIIDDSLKGVLPLLNLNNTEVQK